MVYPFMASNLLSDVAVRNAKAGDKLQSLRDGDGLYLVVHPNGSKYFQLRTTLHGKEKRVQLGIYPDMTLTDARNAARDARKLVADGIDPVQNKRVQAIKQAASAAATFQSVTDQWLAIKHRTLAPTSYRKITQAFNANILPRFGSYPIKDVDALTVRDAMQAMEKRDALELMGKCRAWVRDVFEFALGEGMIEFNPIPQKDLVLKKNVEERHPTLRNREDAGQFLRNLAEYPGRIETRLAIWLQMMVATRPSELRLAEWIEFDLDKGLWTIPLERIKTRKHMTDDHVVPLSRQAVAVLHELHSLTSHSKLLFPGLASTKPISDMTLSKALRTIWPNYRIVPHGFRHFFSTLANGHDHTKGDVIEAALAHKDKNAIRGTYNAATYIKERRELAQWWADELEAMRDGGKILPFKGNTTA
ncbi:putative prophage CPS-53 integrase [mine drainage metagenome]|uniref:Putative prophage CPS-53 integrase n=1 Tax=mine drainage metagenome TaxID=410659 RepID=A0A1J5PYW5_9ZZZZ